MTHVKSLVQSDHNPICLFLQLTKRSSRSRWHQCDTTFPGTFGRSGCRLNRVKRDAVTGEKRMGRGCWKRARLTVHRGTVPWLPSLGWVKHGNWIYILRLLKRVKKKTILQKCSKAIGQFTAFELVCLPVWFSCIYWLHALRQICLDSSQYGQTRRYKTNSVSPTKGASSWGSDGFASFSLNDVAQTGSK